MTVVEHLTELRRRLIISIVAVVGGAALCYWFAPDIIRFFLHYYKDATDGRNNAFIFTGPLDAFATRLKVASYGGIVVVLPIWLWQLWRFITPGLDQREKRYAVPFVLSSVALFAVGPGCRCPCLLNRPELDQSPGRGSPACPPAASQHRSDFCSPEC